MCTRACTCVRVQMCLLGACSRGIGDLVDHVVPCLVLGAWPWRQTPDRGAGRRAPAMALGTGRSAGHRPTQEAALAPEFAGHHKGCPAASLRSVRWAQQTAASAASRGAGRRPWRQARGVAPGTAPVRAAPSGGRMCTSLRRNGDGNRGASRRYGLFGVRSRTTSRKPKKN